MDTQPLKAPNKEREDKTGTISHRDFLYKLSHPQVSQNPKVFPFQLFKV